MFWLRSNGFCIGWSNHRAIGPQVEICLLLNHGPKKRWMSRGKLLLFSLGPITSQFVSKTILWLGWCCVNTFSFADRHFAYCSLISFSSFSLTSSCSFFPRSSFFVLSISPALHSSMVVVVPSFLPFVFVFHCLLVCVSLSLFPPVCLSVSSCLLFTVIVGHL